MNLAVDFGDSRCGSDSVGLRHTAQPGHGRCHPWIHRTRDWYSVI